MTLTCGNAQENEREDKQEEHDEEHKPRYERDAAKPHNRQNARRHLYASRVSAATRCARRSGEREEGKTKGARQWAK